MLSEAHYAAAREIGNEGIVLLKNEGGILPIRPEKGDRILVVGENAIKMMTVGGGSSSLKVQHEISPLQGIREAFGETAEVDYVRGYVGDTSDSFDGVVTGQDLKDGRSADELLEEAVREARNSDYVIFVGGLNKSPHQDCENTDREGLGLPYGQDRVIEALAAVSSRFAVINISGNAVAMPWVDKVPAIVQGWYLGSETGHSIADILSGKANPSGKLPFTFPVTLGDSPAHAVGDYPGTRNGDVWDMEYKEGILVGYRWFDTKDIKPLFAFGHGLSYTDFTYGKAAADSRKISGDDTLTVSVEVRNTGKVTGKEVVQLYISDLKSGLPRPEKELKGFRKVELAPGEARTVTFTISKDDLSFFDAEKHGWVAEPGRFKALIGSASDDIRTEVAFEME